MLNYDSSKNEKYRIGMYNQICENFYCPILTELGDNCNELLHRKQNEYSVSGNWTKQ